MTDGDAGEPISVAIVGMGIAGGTSLLIFAGVAACLALGVLELREWARIVSMASIAAGIGVTILSLFVFKGYMVILLVPSIVCHLLVMTTAVWMLVYFLRPCIKRAFGTLAA
jgi:preprotein translocase subunit SecY